MEILLGVVGSLAAQVPVLTVLVVGIVLAIINKQRLGRASTFALIGLMILLVEIVVGTAISILVPVYANQADWDMSQIGVIFGAISILRSLFAAAAFGCLLAAIFGRRS